MIKELPKPKKTTNEIVEQIEDILIGQTIVGSIQILDAIKTGLMYDLMHSAIDERIEE